MRALILTSLLLLAGCQGVIGEPGEYGPQAPLPVDPQAPRVIAFSCDASAVVTKVPVSCLVQAVHPDGAAVQCSFDSGDGRPAQALGDCTQPQRATVIFGNPGRVQMTVVVTDLDGRSTTRIVELDVTGPPNQVPVIASFTAAPAAGPTPLNTTLTFAATDADTDALTCDLDLGDDGTIEFPALDCATGAQAVTATALGTLPVRLTVKDGRGGEAQATLTLTVQEPRGDLRLVTVDFGQTVMKSELRLVAGKAALLRVSVVGNEAGLPTSVRAVLTANGAALATVALTGPATAPLTESLNDLTRIYRATISAEQVVAGLSIEVQVDPDGQVPETDELNNTRTVTPAIGRGNELHLTAVPVVQGGLTGSARDARATLMGHWPIKDVEAKVRAPYTFSGTLTGGNASAWSTLLSQLAQVRSADGSQRNYYGWARVSYGSGVAGIGYVGQPTSTGRDDSLSTLSHELGHNFGRPHAPCGGVAGADPNYPYAGARLGTWGWDGQRLIDPTRSVDLMSYCSPEWISDYTYERAQAFMEGRGSFEPGAVLPYETAQPALLISGRIAGGKAELSPIYRLRAHPTPPVDSTTALRLTFVDGKSRLVPVALAEVEDLDEWHFNAVVPTEGTLVSVELLQGVSVRLAEVAAPALAPAQALVTRVDAQTVRVRWNQKAWGFAAVAHLAADERTTLSLSMTSGDALVRTDGLAGGRLEVSLSNGLTSERFELELP